MTDRLQEFGHNFQIKSVVCLMTKLNFIEQIIDILDENHYDSDSLKWIVKESKKYFNEYKKPITLDVFKVKVNEVSNDVLKTTIVETLKEVYRYMEAPDLDFVQDKCIDFFKNQTLKNAIIKSVDILESNGDYEAIKNLMDDAMKAGTERNIGHEYADEAAIELRYSEMARNTVETPWDVLNDLMQGGLASGELGVIVAPAGIGKTWILCALGAGAMKRGTNVVHYTLELNEAYVGLRYDSVLTGLANQNLKYHVDEVKTAVEKVKGELVVKYFPTKTASVHTLGAHLQKLRTLGKPFDMVVVDYGDILKDTSNQREVRHALGNIYEDLRGMAGEFDVPIWTASQANRSALDEDVIEATNVAESYQKVMTADFVVSLSRKVEDKIGNTGRFHVIKNRFGPDGLTFPAKVNTNTGQVEIYEGNTVDGKETQGKIDNRDNLMKKMLSSKFDDLMGDE
jgi:archaellum biogenesis ATPase FlaH